MSASSGKQGELIDHVRHWVHFDNLAESLNKQVTNARNLRSEFEEKVLRIMDSLGMRNTILQISGATLQRTTRSKSTDLSWGFLEEQLREYYKEKGKPDDTKQVIEFLQKNRGSKSVEFLKKTVSAEVPVKKHPSV